MGYMQIPGPSSLGAFTAYQRRSLRSLLEQDAINRQGLRLAVRNAIVARRPQLGGTSNSANGVR